MEAHEESGADPPCEDCKKPHDLPSNALAWKVWRMCSEFERPPAYGGIAPIRGTAALEIVKEFGGSEDDLEKVFMIERIMLPWLQEQLKKD